MFSKDREEPLEVRKTIYLKWSYENGNKNI